MGECDKPKPTIRILFPVTIPLTHLDIQLGPSKRTCEDVTLFCIKKLRTPRILSDAVIGGNEELVDIRPAFGLLKVEKEKESVWLPSNHVFDGEVYQYYFRLRHRPKLSNCYMKSNLVTEFFVLQALDDFLKGALGKAMVKAEVPRVIIIELVLCALLLTSSVPLQDSYVIDANFKLKFNLLTYGKRFSKEINRSIITVSGKFNRILDHCFYYRDLCAVLNAYKRQEKTVGFYKNKFVTLLLKNYPAYCFERYSAINSFSNSQVILDLILYEESKCTGKESGLYVDEVRQCGLEDVAIVSLKEHNPDGKPEKQKQMAVEIMCNGPKMKKEEFIPGLSLCPQSQDITLLFDDEMIATSFITMLQGYITLCIRPDLDICCKLTSPSLKVRNSLESFCPMTKDRAATLLEKENEHKAERERCRFFIYENMNENMEDGESRFEIVTVEHGAEEIGHIRYLNGKGFLLYSSSRSDEFANHKTLRSHLKNCYGQQLKPASVLQTVDCDSMFFVKKTVTSLNPFSVQMTERDNGPPTCMLEEDFGSADGLMGCSADERLERIIMVTGEDKKVLVKLVPDKKEYIQALYAGMTNTLRLYRLHPSSILGFYGPVFGKSFSQSYVMEHSPFGNLVEYLWRNIRHLSTQQMMRLALDAVNILYTITQPQESSIHSLLHGNLRGANFWVFRRQNRYFLKLGDPGLVRHYNNLPMNDGANIERELWLSPERQNKLAEVTVASEIYAIATTIAEIFHGGQDLRSVLSKAKERDDKLVAGQPGVGSNNGPLMGESGVGSNGGPVLGEPGVGSNGASVLGESGVGSNGGYVMGESGVGSNGGSVMGESGDVSNSGPQIDETEDEDCDKNAILEFRIPLPEFQTSGEKALMDDVKQVITKLWNRLGRCWCRLPQFRPSPVLLRSQLLDLLEEASHLREETAIEHLKALVFHLHKNDGSYAQDEIQKLSTLEECEALLDTKNDCYIQPHRFREIEEIGSGNFGVTYKGIMEHKGSNTRVALKCNKPTTTPRAEETVQFAKEFNLCLNLSHPNIVKAFGWTFLNGFHYCMVMELINHGNLLGYAQTHKKSLSNPSHISKCLGLCMDIAMGMEHCEKEGIVHCDLAARNVLLNIDQHGNITAKVADFGLSKVLCKKKDYYYQTDNLLMSRPIHWYAPEYITCERNGFPSQGTMFTIEGDIWAYGITLWELFSGGVRPSSTFRGHNNIMNWYKYLYDFYNSGKRLPQTNSMRDDIYELMKMCWSANPQRRARYSAIQTEIVKIKTKYTST